MGRGNVCVTGDFEGLFYIDNDYLEIYRLREENPDDEESFKYLGELSYEELTGGDWVFDEWRSEMEWTDTKIYLIEGLKQRFKSLTDCSAWIGRETRALLENELFYIAVEDNQWSMAVLLLQKEHWCFDLSGLQKRHYQTYLNAIRDVLFDMFPELGVYRGAWTSGRIKREDYRKEAS